MEPCYLPYSKFRWQALLFLCHLWDACFSLQHQLVGLGPCDLESPDSLSRVMPCIPPVPTGCNGTNHMVPLILALPRDSGISAWPVWNMEMIRFLIKVCFSFPPTESKLPGVGPYWWQSSFVKSDVWRLIIALGWEHPRGGGPGRKVVCTVRGQSRENRRLCRQKLCASHFLVICQT